jgi:hypothetical protein
MLCGIVLAADSCSALAQPAVPIETAVDRLLQDALRNNLTLKQERISLLREKEQRTALQPAAA